MYRLIFTLLTFLICNFAIGQIKIHKKCGPAIYLNTRTHLENDSLNQLPFDAIMHVNMRGWGTATFINDSTLITAKHVASKRFLRRMTVYKNVFRNGQVKHESVELTHNDFKIKNVPKDNCHFISSDISFILLTSTGKVKMKNIYTSHMEVADYRTLNLENENIFLTGYPVDLADIGNNNTDILSNKKTTFKELLFDTTCEMVGYKLFTCSGDSGAPLWVELNGKYYIIAIHHGGPEKKTIFTEEERNSAALIRNNILIYNK